MLILALDTATPTCSAALLRGEELLAEGILAGPRSHSERLMPLIDTLLDQCDLQACHLQALAAAAGPGSFTGLRIGLATARGLAQALDLPAVPVCTLAALAESAPCPGALLCPLLDARRDQVYSAVYRRLSASPGAVRVLLPAGAYSLDELVSFLEPLQEKVLFLGEGQQRHGPALEAALPGQAQLTAAPLRPCRAANVALLARKRLLEDPAAPFEEMLPLYHRRPGAALRAPAAPTTAEASPKPPLPTPPPGSPSPKGSFAPPGPSIPQRPKKEGG